MLCVRVCVCVYVIEFVKIDSYGLLGRSLVYYITNILPIHSYLQRGLLETALSFASHCMLN